MPAKHINVTELQITMVHRWSTNAVSVACVAIVWF